MPKYLIATMLAVMLAVIPGLTMLAQEEEPATGETPATEETSATAENDEADDEEEVDDSDLDEQTYEEDEYDFTPSEEIPADQPIPFPSNI